MNIPDDTVRKAIEIYGMAVTTNPPLEAYRKVKAYLRSKKVKPIWDDYYSRYAKAIFRFPSGTLIVDTGHGCKFIPIHSKKTSIDYPWYHSQKRTKPLEEDTPIKIVKNKERRTRINSREALFVGTQSREHHITTWSNEKIKPNVKSKKPKISDILREKQYNIAQFEEWEGDADTILDLLECEEDEVEEARDRHEYSDSSHLSLNLFHTRRGKAR